MEAIAILAFILPAMAGATLRKRGVIACAVWAGFETLVALTFAVSPRLHELQDGSATSQFGLFLAYIGIFVVAALPVMFVIAWLEGVREKAEAGLGALCALTLTGVLIVVRGPLAGMLINMLSAAVLLIQHRKGIAWELNGHPRQRTERLDAARRAQDNAQDLEQAQQQREGVFTYLEQQILSQQANAERYDDEESE